MGVVTVPEVPHDLLYDIEADMWVRLEGSVAVVGATAFGAQQAGEFLIFTPKRPGWQAMRGKALGLVETGKSVMAVRAPISARIVESNGAAEQRPALINTDPYGAGWLFRLEPLALERERAFLVGANEYLERCSRLTPGGGDDR